MSADKQYALGVLFVHGIGTQTRGQTLAAFGGAFCRWLELRCDGITPPQALGSITEQQKKLEEHLKKLEAAEWSGESVPRSSEPAAGPNARLHRVVLRETKLQDPHDPAAPAHTHVALLSLGPREEVSGENWMLAESCWADRFASPSFAELAGWMFRVLPWIVSSHFAVQIVRRVRERPRFSVERKTETSSAQTWAAYSQWTWAFSAWMWRLTSAIGGFAASLLSTVITVPTLALILVLGLLPIPNIRSWLQTVQLRLAATIGDCFVLLSRPIEAAAIVSEVRRDLQWLAGKCSEVVLVAHSQGGAVAHLALRGGVPKEFRLLFTFGSGLRKLEETRELMKNPSKFALSSVLTSIAFALLLALLSTLVMVAVMGTTFSGASIAFALFIWGGFSLALLVAGVQDSLRGVPLRELDHWIEWLRTHKLFWKDCCATSDPVPNGEVTDAAKPNTVEVCNHSSILFDHTSYWSNLDEFVSVLYGEVASARDRDPLPSLRLSKPELSRIAQRRRWRVSIAQAINWAAIAAVVAVMLRRPESAWNCCAWIWSNTGAKLLQVLGAQPDETVEYAVDRAAVGLLALALAPFLIVRKLWGAWNHAEMTRSLASQDVRGANFFALAGLCLQMGIATWIYWYWPQLPSPPFFLCFLGPLVLAPLLITLREHSRHDHPPTTDGRRAAVTPQEERVVEETSVDSLLSIMFGLALAAVWPFGLGLGVWDAVVWFADRLFNGSLGGFRPASISSMAVGGIAVAVVFLSYGIYIAFQKEPADVRPQDPK